MYLSSVIEELDQQRFIDAARPEEEKVDLDFDVILLKPLLNLTIPLLAYSRAQTSDDKQQVLKIFRKALVQGHAQYSSAFLFKVLVDQIFYGEQLRKVAPVIEVLTVARVGARSNRWAEYYVEYGYLDQSEVDEHILKICTDIDLVAKIKKFLKLVISIDCEEVFKNGEIFKRGKKN